MGIFCLGIDCVGLDMRGRGEKNNQQEGGMTTEREDELQEECDKDNASSNSYIKQHYGQSYGPRRTYTWKVIAGQKCLVED